MTRAAFFHYVLYLEIVSERELHYAGVAAGCSELAKSDRSGQTGSVRTVSHRRIGVTHEDRGIRHVENIPADADLVILIPRHRERLLQAHIQRPE